MTFAKRDLMAGEVVCQHQCLDFVANITKNVTGLFVIVGSGDECLN